MRIAIVCGGGILSGKEAMVLQLADGLRDAGNSVEVVSSRWADGRFAQRLAELKVPTHKVWFGFISASMNPKNVYMTAMQLARWPQLLGGYRSFLRRFKPDRVIHTNWHSLLGIFPFLSAPREIYWVHEVMPDKSQYRMVFRWLDRRLKCFVAVSQAVADSLARLGIDRNKIRVIHNGIDGLGFGLNERTCSAGNATIGIVGQVGDWKGHEDLLNAFALVSKTNPEARLDIFGRGAADYEGFLRAKADELGLTDRVNWRGYVADPRQIYSDLAILAVPSRSEDPLPTVAIEAAFHGIPVVASRRGGLTEIVEDGATGFLFDAGNATDMAQHLTSLLRDAQLRQVMGGKARLRAERLFGRERFVQSFSEVLKD